MCRYACASAQGHLLKGAREGSALIARVHAWRRCRKEPETPAAAPGALKPA
jgi:hypothetical protein